MAPTGSTKMAEQRINLSSLGVDLATRSQGKEVRERITGELSRLAEGDLLVVSFDGIGAMSPSFADECFGKLLLDLGRDGFSQKLRLVGANETVRSVVNAAMNNRLRSGRPSLSP